MFLTSIFQKTIIGSFLATNMFVMSPFVLINTNENEIKVPEKERGATPISCQKDSQSKECVIELIEKYAKEHSVDRRFALDIAFCESSFKSEVYGDDGKAFGTYQFHKPTFELFSKKFKEEFGKELSYKDNEHGIELAMWALSNNKEHHWSCFKKIALR